MSNRSAHDVCRAGFFPQSIGKYDEFLESDRVFVHYTSASAALSIIKNQKIWFRNTRCMNDYSEIKHGMDGLIAALNSKTAKHTIENLKDAIGTPPDNMKTVMGNSFASLPMETYIFCLSEHFKNETPNGRLSMWRGYGKNTGVALLFDKSLLSINQTLSGILAYPVSYGGDEIAINALEDISTFVSSNIERIRSVGNQTVWEFFFDSIQSLIFAVKHPAFHEEREWRAVFRPSFSEEGHLEKVTEDILGLPQSRYELPVCGSRPAWEPFKLGNFLKGIIVGPCSEPSTVVRAFQHATSGKTDSEVVWCGVPYRAS